MRSRRHSKFGAQFPDALDVIVRSLRAGHPVPVAIAMVAHEMPDPVGTEFGIVSDEITYGADLETAMRNLYFRVGQEDLPLFVTAVAIQASTGGKLSEILANLSRVIRQRFKMRRKIKALAAEGRFSAMFLSGVPVALFLVLKVIAPDFYASVWHHDFTKWRSASPAAGCWWATSSCTGCELQDLTMDAMFELVSGFRGRRRIHVMVSALVFLSAAALAFGVMAVVAVRVDVKRRAAGISTVAGQSRATTRARCATPARCDAAADRLHHRIIPAERRRRAKELRRRLIQAGFLDPRAPRFLLPRPRRHGGDACAAAFLAAPTCCSRKRDALAERCWSAEWTATLRRRSISAAASRGGRTSIARAFRTSWTCWSFAPMPA